jgi:hypothetical protein
MLQMFHIDVVKVDRNVAYAAMVVHVCFKCLQTYVARMFIWMLHMCHTYVASVLSGCCLQWFQVFFYVFLRVFQTYVLSVSSVFIHMLQLLYREVLKLDRVLHLPAHLLLPRLGVSFSPSVVLHPS